MYIYPNPVSTNNLIIRSDKEICNIEIGDNLGKKIKDTSESDFNRNGQIGLKDLSKGIYYIKIFYKDGKSYSKALIKLKDLK